VLDKHDTEVHEQRVEHQGRRLSPRIIVAAIVAAVLVAFVLANTSTAEINFLVDTVTAPIWLVLTVVIVVAFGAGLLLGSFSRRR